MHYLIPLTHQHRLFADLLREVGAFGETVQVSLQDIPAYFVVEGEAELGMNLKEENDYAITICCAPSLQTLSSHAQVFRDKLQSHRLA